ncbi:uncharacterized protein [Ptychodera flava]|uniref:uncharacterized protein n=1 Tax=Ptychodera flava TaxID=63121 RepID=UPI003969CF74
MCKELSFPPPDIIDKDVDAIADFYRERNLGYRLQVMFLGYQGSGKSSLVKSLTMDTAMTVDEPTDGLEVQLWNPFHRTTHELLMERELTSDERTLGLDMWDTSGRMVYQHCFQLVMNASTLYVIVCDLTSAQSCDSVVDHVNRIQVKAPGSKILIVGTRLDKLQPDVKRASVCNGILKSIRENEDKQISDIKTEISRLQHLGSLKESRINVILLKLQCLLENRPCISDHVIPVSCCTAQGLDDVRTEILLQALDTEKFPHLTSSFQVPTTDVFNDILELRKDGVVLLSWQQCVDLMLKNGSLEKDELLDPEMRFLQQTGGILKFEFPKPLFRPDNDDNNRTTAVCLFPEALVGTLCSVHVDDDQKAFQFESSRFWPKDSVTRKPHPSDLVRALEEIPSQGLIRPCLLPLLWQKYHLEEEQVRELLWLFEQLGFLVCRTNDRKTTDFGELFLPNFPHLSTQIQYCVPLLKLLPDNEPKLNWTPKPFPGDLQIGLRYKFACHIAVDDLITRLVAYCKHQTRRTESYQHYWRNGVLLKIGQVYVNIAHESSDSSHSLTLQGRITVDEEGEQKATEVIWVTLARFLYALEAYLSDWQGLFIKVYIKACAYYFTTGDDNDLDTTLEVPLLDCLHALDSGKILLRGDNGLTAWELRLDLLLPLTGDKTQDILTWYQWMSKQESQLSDVPMNTTMSVSGDKLPAKRDEPHGLLAKIDKPTKRKGDIKWDVDEDKKKVTEENEIKEANRVAAAFVAAVLAGATAQYLAEQYSKNDKGQDSEVSLARQSAVQASASAAKAAQSGDSSAAVKAVADAAKAVDQVVKTDKKPLKNGNASTHVKSSKMCQLL